MGNDSGVCIHTYGPVRKVGETPPLSRAVISPSLLRSPSINIRNGRDGSVVSHIGPSRLSAPGGGFIYLGDEMGRIEGSARRRRRLCGERDLGNIGGVCASSVVK